MSSASAADRLKEEASRKIEAVRVRRSEPEFREVKGTVRSRRGATRRDARSIFTEPERRSKASRGEQQGPGTEKKHEERRARRGEAGGGRGKRKKTNGCDYETVTEKKRREKSRPGRASSRERRRLSKFKLPVSQPRHERAPVRGWPARNSTRRGNLLRNTCRGTNLGFGPASKSDARWRAPASFLRAARPKRDGPTFGPGHTVTDAIGIVRNTDSARFSSYGCTTLFPRFYFGFAPTGRCRTFRN